MSKLEHDFKQEIKRLEIIFQLLNEKDLRGLRLIEIEQDIKKSLSEIEDILKTKVRELQ